MFYIISLLLFIENRFVRAYNETCSSDEPPLCPDPLQCINGYCLCSKIGTVIESKTSLAFWTGEECITCPLHYTTSGTKCFNLIMGKSNQLTWDSAREHCQKDGGDLLVFRENEEFEFISNFIRSHVKDTDMLQQTPRNGTHFASIWIGARLTNWSRVGTYDIVSHGPILTTNNRNWCQQNSLLGQEPNYVGLKPNGERQTCIGIARFKDSSVCLHDWFCSWKTYLLCEIHPPLPTTTTKLMDKRSNPSIIWISVGGGGALCILVSLFIGIVSYIRKKKTHTWHTRSFDSTDSGMSQNSLY